MVLPNFRSRPNTSLVFVNDRSLLTPVIRVVNSGVCTWWEEDSRKPVFSVTGNDTRNRGDSARCPVDGTITRPSELAYAVSLVAALTLQPGLLEMNPGVLENSALGS